MISDKAITYVMTKYCATHVALISSGVVFDADRINNAGGSKIYFTYPEAYDESCKNVSEEYPYVEGATGLFGDPRAVSASLVRRYLYLASVLSQCKDFDCDEDIIEVVDRYEDFMDVVTTAFTLLAKVRKGDILTYDKVTEDASNAAKELIENMEKKLEQIRNGEEFTEV